MPRLTKTLSQTSTDEKSVVNSHSNELPYKFAVNVMECQDKPPTMYWLLKLQKDRIKLGPLQTLALVVLENFLN